jgi:hypothetical protein
MVDGRQGSGEQDKETKAVGASKSLVAHSV